MKIPAMRMLLPIFSKSSRKNTASYLAAKIQVQKIESALREMCSNTDNFWSVSAHVSRSVEYS